MSESRKNINEIVAALERLRNSNGNFKTDDKVLFDECRLVFEKLKRLSDFDPDNIEKVIDVLNKFPADIKELEVGELGMEAEKMDSKALDKQDLKQLIEDYEKATNADKKEELHQEIYKITGKRNVDQFIKTQKEIAAKNKEKLEKLSPELREKVTQDLAKISDEEHKVIADVLEKATLEEEFNKKELEKEIKKVFKEKEEAAKFIKKVEEIRAKIKVENKAEEIAQKTYEKLKEEGLPVSEKLRGELKENILVAIKKSEELELPEQLKDRSQDVSVVEVKKEVEIFKQENLTDVVNYRATELKKEIGFDLREKGVRNEVLIEKYASIVAEYTYNPETTRVEVNNRQIETEVGGYLKDNKIVPKISPMVATEEAQFMANNLPMAPMKFKKLRNNYNAARKDLEELGIRLDKLPKIKEARVVEKMMNQFNKNPRVRRMMVGAQRMVRFLDTVDRFPGSVLVKIGARDLGVKIIGKIGGKAAVDFVTNAAIVLAEQGTEKGLLSIATAMFTKGAIIAGEAGGATAGALTSIVTAFQALPVVGQVAAIVTGAVILLKSAIDSVKGVLGKVFGSDMNGVSRFLGDTLGLGKVVGGIGQFGADVATFLIGIPALLAIINLTAIVTPVVIFFFLGIFTYSLFQQNMVSSLVPPAAVGGGNCMLKDIAESEGLINCDQNAPANDYPGINRANFVGVAGRWKTGKNYSEECYNDTVNRALCAGINPAYALWAWAHESGASNYSIDLVEDFGIHGRSDVPPKNYNAQITAFLKLDPGNACPQLEYWLAFGTNYLTGGCDPDFIVCLNKSLCGGKTQIEMKKMVANNMMEAGKDYNTGKTYRAEMEKTWSWVSSQPLPANIKVAKGGKSCGSSGGDVTDTPITNEYTDENGQVWVCYGPMENDDANIPDFEPWDPSIPIPEGCPDRRPSAGYFTQGPFASGCSHQNMSVPAIDLGVGDGTPIVATHPGVAVLGHDSIYGFFVDIHGKCEGKDFYTRYAHMPQGGYRVANNSTVAAGQQIGVVNNTGSSTGPHLHYHISGLDSSKFGQYLGLSVAETKQLWGCCGSWNGIACP